MPVLTRLCAHSTSKLTRIAAHSASEEEVLLARLLEKALRRSEAVDREALCIVAGQKVSRRAAVESSH